MVDQIEKYAVEVAALVAACEPLRRGDILTREVIQGVLHIEPNTGHWQHVVHRVMRRVERDRGVTMWPVLGVGFKLLTEPEQIEVSQRRRKRAIRQLRRGIRSVRALPTAGLSLHEQRGRAAQLQSLQASERALIEAQARCASFSRPTETNPKFRPGPAPTIPLPDPTPREASDGAGPAESAA